MEEEQKEVTESSDTGEGNKQTSNDPIDRAVAAREGLDKENARLEANIKRLEDLKARDILGGKSETGEPVKKETDAEYAAKILSGNL
jgi:hypothetical protein